MLIRRHIKLGDNRTTLALEPLFWETIDTLSDGEANEWIIRQLRDRPATEGMSSWLRQRVLAEVLRSGRTDNP